MPRHGCATLDEGARALDPVLRRDLHQKECCWYCGHVLQPPTRDYERLRTRSQVGDRRSAIAVVLNVVLDVLGLTAHQQVSNRLVVDLEEEGRELVLPTLFTELSLQFMVHARVCVRGHHSISTQNNRSVQ